MESQFFLACSDDVQATLQIKATVGEFKSLRDQINAYVKDLNLHAPGWPLYPLLKSVEKVIQSANANFDANVPKEGA